MPHAASPASGDPLLRMDELGSELLGSRDQLDTTRHRCAHTRLVASVCPVLAVVVGVIGMLYMYTNSSSNNNNHHAQCAAVKPTLNDTNIREAVSSCLDEAPVDGNCPSNAFGPIACWNVSAVQNMSAMFCGIMQCHVSAWNVSTVHDVSSMFERASAFNGDLSAWDVSAVQDMSRMFEGASAFNGDLSAWDVSAVQNMSGMFDANCAFNSNSDTFHCDTAFNGDLSAWDVSAVQDMSSMFEGASAFNGNLSAWDVSAVQDMSSMFSGAPGPCACFHCPVSGGGDNCAGTCHSSSKVCRHVTQ